MTNPAKPAIEAHFRPSVELERLLIKKGNQAALESIRHTLPEGVTLHITYQHESLGLGHAVLCAEEIVGNRPFAVMLPDDLIDGGGLGCLADMVELYNSSKVCSLAVEKIPREHTNRYGIVQLKGHRIVAMVEKPEPEDAPSTLAVVGRYVLPNAIFAILKTVKPGFGGEIQLTDGISAILNDFEFRAHTFEGTRYDCGNKLGHLKANMAYAFKDPALAEPLRHWLHTHLLKS